MQINMDTEFKCGDAVIEYVAQFKYLGLIIDRAKNHPGSML